MEISFKLGSVRGTSIFIALCGAAQPAAPRLCTRRAVSGLSAVFPGPGAQNALLVVYKSPPQFNASKLRATYTFM